MSGTIQAGRLAGRSLSRSIWILAVPVFAQQLMQAFVGMFDKMLAGHLPASIRIEGLDAIGVGSYVGWFIGIAMAGLGIGGQAIIARAMGSGDLVEGRRAQGQAMTLSLGWGFLVGLLLFALARPLAQACGLTDDATAYFVDYISILALAMPCAAVMMVGAMCLHGAGETLQPSLIAVGVNVVNVIASWWLSGVDVEIGGSVLVNPSPLHWNVSGIAAGTALSYLAGAGLTMMVLRRRRSGMSLARHDMSLDLPMIRRIVRIGVPNFMEGISMWAVNLFVLSLIGVIAARSSGGAGLQGAHIIAIQWEAFSFLPGFAIGTAAGTLAGQYLGAGNPKVAARAVLACTGVAVVMMGSLGVLFITSGDFLTSLISREPIHTETVPELLRICGYVQIFFAITMVMRQGLRGVGDTRWTLLITTVSSYGVRLPAAWFFGVHMEMGLRGIWYGLCGEFVVRAILFSARFWHGGWKRIKV